MSTLLYTLVAVFVLGLFLYKPLRASTRFLTFVTPVGLAVTVVWIVLLALYLVGWQIDPTVLATVMGGSLVVHAYGIERRNPRTAVLMVMAAIMVTYAILNERWLLLAIGVAILGLFWVAIVQKRPHKNDMPKSVG